MSKLSKKYAAHQEHTKEIWLHPKKTLGLEHILLSTHEANIFNRKQDLYRQPDNILFDYRNHKIYNIEYKLHDGQRNKALKQLSDTRHVLERMFKGYEIISLYIHDNYKIERIL